jgi:hypothetical protein
VWDNPRSPQRHALEWLVSNDTITRSLLSSTTLSEDSTPTIAAKTETNTATTTTTTTISRIQTRYALAVLYFSTTITQKTTTTTTTDTTKNNDQSSFWTETFGFLDPHHHECEWTNSDRDLGAALQCDDLGQIIVGLNLGESIGPIVSIFR